MPTIELFTFSHYQIFTEKAIFTIINSINPAALIMAKTLLSFGRSECNRVQGPGELN